MFYQIQLARKNLFRYGRRTFITAIAISVGLAIFILMDSLLAGMSTESERNLIHYETGPARIMTNEYWDNKDTFPLEKNMAYGNEAEKLLKSEGYSFTRRFSFSADMVFYQDPFPEDGNIQILTTAIDPLNDDNIFRFKDHISRGRYLESGEDGILIGAWLADDIGADVGHSVTIVTRTMDGYYQTMDLDIVGIIDCPNSVINRKAVYIPIETASDYLDMQNLYTQLVVSLPLGREVELSEKLESDLSGTEFVIKNWRILGADYIALAEAKESGATMILFFVFLIAAVGISNTMMMAIFERMKEIGMMQALGMTVKQIRNMFLMEAGGIGLIGSVLGTILGILVNIPFVYKGIDVSFMLRDIGDIGYRFSGVMYGIWNPGSIVITLFSGVLMTVLVAMLALRKALKRDIPSCLRAT